MILPFVGGESCDPYFGNSLWQVIFEIESEDCDAGGLLEEESP